MPRLRAYLDEHPADLAISVFATGASAVSTLAERYPAMTHVVFCTDVTPHRLWVHPHVDLYLVTSVVAEAAVRRFEPEARVLVIPPAVRPAFYSPPAQWQARGPAGRAAGGALRAADVRRLGPGPGRRGGRGAGRRGRARARGGRAATPSSSAGCARWRTASRGCARSASPTAIPELMSAADLVVTSSGDTCTEARTVGRPLLLLDVVQGHGRDNLQHELELGDAGVTSPQPGSVVRTALAMLDRIKPPEAGPTRTMAAWETAFTSALETIGA